jgi:hypothetical protein
MAKQVKRTTRRGSAKSRIALPNEKSVRDTAATLPVKPPKVSRREEERIAPAAVDRRRQVIQTEEEMRGGDACPPAKRARK